MIDELKRKRAVDIFAVATVVSLRRLSLVIIAYKDARARVNTTAASTLN